MSTKYNISDDVPSEVLCKRLGELSDAVTKGRKGIEREFYMSVPAQCDLDADLVLSASAKRIEQFRYIIGRVIGVDFRVPGEVDGDRSCFYCMAYLEGGDSHESDCPYIEAKKLFDLDT